MVQFMEAAKRAIATSTLVVLYLVWRGAKLMRVLSGSKIGCSVYNDYGKTVRLNFTKRNEQFYFLSVAHINNP